MEELEPGLKRALIASGAAAAMMTIVMGATLVAASSPITAGRRLVEAEPWPNWRPPFTAQAQAAESDRFPAIVELAPGEPAGLPGPEPRLVRAAAPSPGVALPEEPIPYAELTAAEKQAAAAPAPEPDAIEVRELPAIDAAAIAPADAAEAAG